jgi:citrate lyase subunit beta/citryl-CoA lyase
VNPPLSGHLADDLEAVRQTDYATVMLPKAERPDDLLPLAGRPVIALCETALGIVNAPSLAAVRDVVALMWGAEDLITSLGGRSRLADGAYRDVVRVARSTVLMAAKARGKPSVDAAHLDIGDTEGLVAAAADAAASGFDFMGCIHPDQVDIVRSAYRPDAEQLRWAHSVIEAVGSGGVATVRGQMVDAPHLAQATRLLQAARRS